MSYTLEEQKLLIEAILSNSELFSRCQNIILPDYFDKQFQKTIKIVLEFAEKYGTMPTPDQIYSKTGLDFKLIGDIEESHQKYFLDELEKFCRHAALTKAILDGAELINKGEYNSIEKLVKDALLIGLEKDMGLDYFDDPRARLVRLREMNGQMKTGWNAVDKMLYNVGRGELMIFAAPSGGGKSVALQNLSVNFGLQNLNVVYITLELSQELCAKRIDSMLTGVETTEIYKRLDDVELLVKQASKRAGNITIKKMPIGVCSRDLKTYLKEYQIQKGHKPDVLIVDYLDLMMPNDRRVSPSDLYVKDKFVSEELRALAVECDLLLVTASQLNRSAIEQNEYDHSHIGGGLSKIQTCDNAIGIFNSATARDRGEIEFQYLKTRNSSGVGQKTRLRYNINTLRITDMEFDDEKPTTSKSNNIMNQIKRTTAPLQPTDNSTSVQPASNQTIEETQSKTKNLIDLINKTKG